jgi:poly(A) polymerase
MALAYDVGSECAVDRLLLSGRADEAASVASSKVPRLPISGGALIARGLREGPVVARTLKAIESRWVSAGFPSGEEFEQIVADELARAS